MYVFKNALTNITRAKGRSILIFILVLVIAISACVALSIQSSAETAKTDTYNSMSVTATISTNRSGMMGGMSGDRDAMKDMMSKFSEGLSTEEYLTYASAESVYDFYYTSTISLAMITDGIENYSTSSSSSMPTMKNDKGGMMGGMGINSGDFTVTGYSSHNAMTNFIDGTLVITDGSMFDSEDATNTCVISEEIAILNELSIGDTFTLANTMDENDLVEFTIGGIFGCESTDVFANDIYISYTSIENIVTTSESVAGTFTNEMTGEEMSSALTLRLNGTYVFENPDKFESFTSEAEALGLDTEMYTVSSMDIATFESSLVPLENLSDFTMIFFLVVLAIGAIILIVFNLFTIRERKYEIGVLAAIGMPKPKVAVQFISEVVIITFVSVIMGTMVGSVISNPIGTTLLENQISSTESQSSNISQNFGGNFGGQTNRGEMMGGMPSGGMMGNMNGGVFGMFGGDVDYIDNLNTSTSFIVLLQLMGIGILLSILSSSVGVISILRYEPLKILSERA